MNHHVLKNSCSFLIVVFLFFISEIVCSQEKSALEIHDDPAIEDIKVGVVLSGGGAKGLAHIGVLKVIEDAGVRIDYIGGTSMGAIIGSLYASGYSAKDLDSIVRTLDFNSLIQDDLPRNAKTFYERDDSEKYVLTLPFDNFKIGLPSGLSKGQNFFNVFSRLTAHVNNINDFSKLPIPFFCVATNIANGQQVILDNGYLPQAVAASGALPSIFSPVEIDNILLTDGGVSNNFPIKEIRERGAEIVIGIDVQDSLLPVDELNSVTNIMLQISNFRTIDAMKTKRPLTDVYIHPDITNFSLLSFEEDDQLIKNGEKAALEKMEILKAIRNRQQSGFEKSKIETPSDTIRINSISIQGNNRYTRAYIKGKLKLKNPEKITYKRLYEGINNLSATGNFDRVNHRIVRKEWGNELLVNVKESDNTMLLRFALHYDDLYKTAGLNNFTKKRLLFNNDVLSMDVILGDNIRYDFAYYIDKGYYWSVGITHNFNRFKRAIDYEILQRSFELPIIDVNSIDMDFLDIKTQFYAETIINQNFTFGIGAEHRRFRLISETIGEDKDRLPRIVFDNNDYGSAFSYLRFDSYNNKYFPSSGVFFNGNLNYYLLHSNENNAEEPFAQFKGDFGYAVSPFHKASILLNLGAGARFGGEQIQSFNFFMGGFGAKTTASTVPFYGYDFLDLNGDSYAKAGVSFDYEIFPKNHLNASVNYANIGSQLYRTGRWFESPEYSGYALGYGMETFAGPLQVKYSYSPEIKNGEWFFSLGFWF